MIVAGDYIAYAVGYGDTVTLKFGRVLSIDLVDRYFNNGIEIKAITVTRGWKGFELQKKGKPVVLSFPERIIVLGPMSVDEEARELLDKAYDSHKV
jgi:hypothetical protein